MFTGIIEEVGTVEQIDRVGDCARLTIRADEVLSDAKHGASIAVDGVCLTVTEFDTQRFTVDVMAETLRCTHLGDLVVGGKVNLERAMRADGRFDGHIVQGHVDGTGQVLEIEPSEHWTNLTIAVPAQVGQYVVPKGSITIDGVSLTVASCEEGRLTVSLIPTTLALTTLGDRWIGDPVNLEADVLAKYAARLLGGLDRAAPTDDLATQTPTLHPEGSLA
ncbi:riboflavin synthase [Calidifontibacter indicus]|uniref:Riboflavin synthase n=1 Tax=Calidifontibacter indicus TaxID=419650 RepID=A0A3D9USM9_9MICO|nr:riboflavin synthase [Calidifontibacter indicus]REF30990.1 riboflavin synthase alpha chain [Calidifontibacter indicus]